MGISCLSMHGDYEVYCYACPGSTPPEVTGMLKWTNFLHLEVGMPLLTPAQSSLHKTITHVRAFPTSGTKLKFGNFTRKCNLWKSVIDQVPMLLHSCLPLHRGSFGIHR
ncbi:unnamed protein product [Sphagnum troendelagicum]|uniref:Uncharacterized protein n=1 Tax=Sphagnum troendelagicum TaxID=128251 RepID=A0ABP0UL30_9BRYO